jgi:hypothetical protein
MPQLAPFAVGPLAFVMLALHREGAAQGLNGAVPSDFRYFMQTEAP